MLSQAASDRQELAKLLHISDDQMSYCTNTRPGCGLLKYGSALVPFINDFPENTRLYQLVTTQTGRGRVWRWRRCLGFAPGTVGGSKATLVPRTAARAAKSGAQYAAQRADGAQKAGESVQSGGGPEEAAANFLSNTLTDAERRVVLAPARMGYRLSKWGLRKYVQHRRAAKAQAAARTAPPHETSPQGAATRVARADPGSCSPWPRQSVFHKRLLRPGVCCAGTPCNICCWRCLRCLRSSDSDRPASMTLRGAKPSVKSEPDR